MRLVILVVIALALVSVSSQNLLGFGEFIEGHNAAKVFKVIKCTDATFNKAVQSMNILASAGTSKSMGLIGSCSTCSNILGKAPVCTPKGCTPAQREANNYINTIVFANPSTSASKFWDQKSTGPFEVKDGSRSVTFVLNP